MAEDSLRDLLKRFSEVNNQIHEEGGILLSSVRVSLGVYWMAFEDRVAYSPEPFTRQAIKWGVGLREDDRSNLHVIYKEGLAFVGTPDRSYYVFDSDLECKDPAMTDLYREVWG